MRMNFGPLLEIEDLGNHPAATVISLGILLAGIVNALPDPKRKNLYEVQGGSTIYYIYVSPVSGTISLLASWKNQGPALPRFDVACAALSRTPEARFRSSPR
ncbi:MAG TPA: hypothetical protein VEJ45_11695 [Candidatus Acidoferrales bacterium]|nr:hypothetical protein [Candidatus Acidoferrales bacterium]